MATATPSTNEPLSRPELLEAWLKDYGNPAPKGISTRLLRLACEYNKQVREHGGLGKGRLRELLAHAASPKGTGRPVKQTAKATKPVTGTRLVRQWQGKTHVVDIQQGSVLYQNKSYGSLSQVAREITGARWSGPRFFGV